MVKIRVMTEEEVKQQFSSVSRRAQRDEDMQVYREAVAQLGNGHTGGVIDLDEGDNPRQVQMRLHKAARDAGFNIRFQRQSKNPTELKFRLQTPDETARLKERGRNLAEARKSKKK